MGFDICCQLFCNDKPKEVNLVNVNCCAFSNTTTNYNIRRLHNIININCCAFDNNIKNYGTDENNTCDNDPFYSLSNVKIIFIHINFGDVKVDINVSYNHTVDQLLRKYMETLKVPSLINTDYITFLYGDKALKFGDKTEIKYFFGHSPTNQFQVNVYIPLIPINNS